MEAVFVQFMPRHNEDQLPLRESHETAVRRVGGSCEMAASPRAEDHPLLEDVTKQHNEDCD
jgi:hypothetical protein